MTSSDSPCQCGCGEMTVVTKASEPCACGCECCSKETTPVQEIIELEHLRVSVEARMAELVAKS